MLMESVSIGTSILRAMALLDDMRKLVDEALKKANMDEDIVVSLSEEVANPHPGHL